MGIISTIKSVLGMGDSGRAGETSVSVEREPDAATERAVKEEPAAEPGDAAAEPDETGADADAGESVEEITGIGPAYADRLADAGIRTVAQLADADAAEIAAETDLSEGRIETWIERARER